MAVITQEELAEKLELTVRYVQSVEAAKENLTVETMAKVGNTPRTPIAEFLVPPSKRTVKRGRPPTGVRP